MRYLDSHFSTNDPGEKLLQPPLFRKESASELNAKTKGSDRISLMVQEGTHSPNVTLKGYPKNSGVCLVRKLTKHNRSHYFTPKRRFILNPNKRWTDLQPKCKPKHLPYETLGFSWDGHVYNTAKFPDWLQFPKLSCSLATTLLSISWSLHDFPQPDFTMCTPYTHIYMSHISHFWKNLQAYNIEGTVQQEREHKFQRAREL